jgi:hypothetical protein
MPTIEAFAAIRHSQFVISFEVPMHSRHLLRVGLAFVMISFLAALSHAADYSFYIGGVLPGSVEHNGKKTSLDNSPIFGFRVATRFAPHFGMEHTVAFSADYLFPKDIEGIEKAKGFVYHSNLILRLPVGKTFVPYLTAGAGMIRQYGDSDMPVGTRFSFNYGGGLQVPRLAGPLGVRVDLRGYSVGIFSNKLSMFEISGGVMLSMGK